MSASLIVGLANPGQQYQNTRHNAGAWFVQQLADKYHCTLKPESKFNGFTGRCLIDGHEVRLLIPTTFMNNSGQASAALAQFFKIDVTDILVAHDELDLNPGTVRFKQGGGHGGHNGLKSIVSCHGNSKAFGRLRIGIGHPGHASQVTGFVLSKAPAKEQQLMDQAISEAVRLLPSLLSDGYERAMNQLNGFKATP